MEQKKSPYIMSLFLGPLFLIFTLFTQPPFEGMSTEAYHTAGLALFMATWWITEVVPIPVTSLLPIILIPLLNMDSIAVATAGFAHPLIFLFLGGFVMSLAMERWHLHKRIALLTMMFMGTKPSQQIAGIMIATAFLSMWMSNTATSVMMLPIGLSIIALVQDHQHSSKNSEDFAKALLLGIAYSASIGGIATLIGTPPNALLAAFLIDNYGIELGFGRWMAVGLPLAIVMLFITWLWLTKLQFKVNQGNAPETTDMLSNELKALGKMSRAEKMVSIIFILTALSWIFRPQIAKITGLSITDTGIAMIAASLMFALPVHFKTGERLLAWEDAKKVPWGILLLFGGGLSLAAQIKNSGLANFIAQQLSLGDQVTVISMILVVTLVIIFLTEITSNTATTAAFLPLLGPIALAMGADNPSLLAIPAALAASCAFMMPVATPPNAIVFSSGQLRIMDMVKAGFLLNLVAVVLITLICGYWVGEVFNLHSSAAS